jgi:hypothetical protein
MSFQLKGKVLPACVVLASLAVTTPASATLGEDVASVALNHANLGGALRVTTIGQGPGGERHELTLPSGVVVRQYVAAGVVYAIAWSGPRAPDLRELLGSRFSKLSLGHGHHVMSLQADDFRVEAMAHRGSFTGRAWVPSLVPAGVVVRGLP